MNKRGQFYIIAAIIIIIVLLTVVGIVNYTKKEKQNVKIYDLSNELKTESAKVIDYAVYNKEDVQSAMSNFTQDYFLIYAQEKEPNSELVFIYGSADEGVNIVTYTQEDTGNVNINIGGSTMVLNRQEGKLRSRQVSPSDINNYMINVTLLENTYDFELQKGQNFFFVIKKSLGDEEYVARN